QIHGRWEEIFADAFDHISLRFDGLAGLDEIIVERAVGVDADDLDLGVLFLQVFANAADRAASAHAADEVSDLAFRVFPDFRTGRAVVGLRVHRVVVLIRVVGIRDFARQFFGDRVVAARILRLDGGGADDDLSSEPLQQVDFFLRLFIGRREDTLIATDGSDQRQSHSSVAGSAFDDRAAGLEQARAFGFVDHGDADTVLHRAAGVGHLGLDPDLGLEALRNTVQPYQRRMAHRFQNVVALHRFVSLAPPESYQFSIQ